MEDQTLIIFNCISKFISELNSQFSDKQRSLQLYSRLIEKTTIVHEEPIKKHIDAFKSFCINNRDAISKLDYNLLVQQNVTYSERVYVNIHSILKDADKEETKVIWKYILSLSAYLDPSNKAKEMLKKSMESSGNTGGKEEDFLTNIINEVEGQVDPTQNPMEAVSNIMQSGLFSNLVGNMNSGLQNGELDLGKLMGTVQTMVGSLNQMTQNMDTTSEPGMPDLSGMVGQMNNMMNQLNQIVEHNSDITSDVATISEINEEKNNEKNNEINEEKNNENK